MKTVKQTVWVIAFLIFVITAKSQETESNGITHLQVKRLNDSYIDVNYNKPIKNKMPIMIFCQGSGYDSNTKGFLGVIGKFKNLVVGLAIEKQGVKFADTGDKLTQEYIANNTIQNRLYDYLRVLQYLRTHADWWNGEIYIIGGSEGGLLGGMLACYYPNVKGLSIFSFGGGLNFGEAWPISIGLQEKADGATKEDIEKKINLAKDSLQLIRNEPTFSKSYSGSDNTYAWWNSIMNLRLENCLLDLNVPIYLAQGSLDIMAPPISAQKLNQNFIKEGKTNLFYKEFEGYDHAFFDKEGKSHLVEVITECIDWILKK
ncbi:MAG: hypothetical protein ABI315_02110 [Bacteroidia bacterium]